MKRSKREAKQHLSLMSQMFTYLARTTIRNRREHRATVGAGVKRAAEHLAAHRAKWDDVPKHDEMTRQRRRQALRRYMKARLSGIKAEAMRLKVPGGSAIFR